MAKHYPSKDLNFRLSVLKSAEKIGITKTTELFNLNRGTIYRWEKKYTLNGPAGLFMDFSLLSTRMQGKSIPEVKEISFDPLLTDLGELPEKSITVCDWQSKQKTKLSKS